ncbi:MAG: aminotransferase class III-fold pyridoxal phosphate-dependent enzyme, partial [Elusimicrobia bacterium]|nr:aminotransferase class III-fold pyridoxal phosphate-dependent enzyme [Elusimicrobiota bacterium]
MPKTASPVKAGYPRIATPPPGPKARAVIAKDKKFSSPSYIKEYPLVIAGGAGAMVEDVDGNRYIDWMAGIAVCSTGYRHPLVTKAVQSAAAKFLHICGTDFYYQGFSDLCEALARSVPGGEKWRVFLSNSGTEAIEGAVKLARHHTRRSALISFHGSFHGRSYAAMTLTTSKVKYRKGFGPLLPEVHHLPFHNPYRNTLDECVKAAKSLFETRLDPSDVAAVVMEPLQGEGGYVLPSKEFLRFWREFCDEHGILLVFDEVQCGAGRTGTMWAFERCGVTPDVFVAGKGLGSGLPIGAIVAKEAVMTWPRGSHGSTYGGNPVACAAALATIGLIKDGLAANADKMGARLMAGLRKLQAKHRCIGDVRGLGLFIG